MQSQSGDSNKMFDPGMLGKQQVPKERLRNPRGPVTENQENALKRLGHNKNQIDNMDKADAHNRLGYVQEHGTSKHWEHVNSSKDGDK